MSSIKSKQQLLNSTSRRLKYLRKNKNLSQKAVAARCKMDFGSYTNIKNGKRNITLLTLQKKLKALNVGFKDFFNFKGFWPFLKVS